MGLCHLAPLRNGSVPKPLAKAQRTRGLSALKSPLQSVVKPGSTPTPEIPAITPNEKVTKKVSELLVQDAFPLHCDLFTRENVFASIFGDGNVRKPRDYVY